MADITLPLPGEDPNWGSKLNTAILRINQELESLGVQVSVMETGLSTVTMQLSGLRGRLTALENNLEDQVQQIAEDVIASDPTVLEAARTAAEDIINSKDVVIGDDGRALPTPAYGNTHWSTIPPGMGYSWGVAIASQDHGDYMAVGVRDTGELTARFPEEVVQSGDGRALPTEPHGTTYWGPLPRSTGYLWGVVASSPSAGDYVALGVKLNGDIGGRVAGQEVSDTAGVFARVRNAVQEWWISPVVERQEGWYATGGIGNGGEVLAIDIDDHTPPVAVQVGIAGVDDHNAPARVTIPGRGSLIQWTHHSGTPMLYVVVAPGNGRAETFRGRPRQSLNIGGATSYGQWFLQAHKRTSTTDTFWVLVRNSPTHWGVAEVAINWSTGDAALVKFMPFVEFTAQPYMVSREAGTNSAGNPCLRIAVGYNPSAARHEVYLVELDLVTGIAKDMAQPSVTHQLAAGGSYLQDTSLTPAIPDTSGTRRLLGIRPREAGEEWGILTVEYTSPTVNPAGVITETLWTSAGVGAKRTFGSVGAHRAQYPAGAQYAPDGTVWHSNEAGGTWVLSHEGEVVHRSTKALMRPMPTSGGPVACLVSENGIYVNYQNWGDTDLLAISKEP